MNYVSTRTPDFVVDFETAFMASQPPKEVGGLYVPQVMPKFSRDEILGAKDMDFPELATLINKKFIGKAIPEDVIRRAMKERYNFPIPLEKIEDNRYLSWLTKGPTSSYKDIPMAPLGSLYGYLLRIADRSMLSDNSTTGDTGPSGANTMKGVYNTLFVVKYPKVTPKWQKLQMTTQGAVALEMDTDFDTILKLQGMLAQDEDVIKAIGGRPATLNSTNHQRITNEITYYLKNWAELAKEYGDYVKPIFSVPFGNGSNTTAADYARRMGVPMDKIIIANNSNDTVTRFLKTGVYEPRPTVVTHATAMDITKPNNFKRIVYYYDGILDDASEKILKMPDLGEMRNKFEGIAVDNFGIEDAMKRLLEEHDRFICPHGAVAEQAAETYIRKHSPKQPVVSFMTADPAKFVEVYAKVMGIEPPIPKALKDLENKEQVFHKITKEDFTSGKAYSKYKQIVLDAVRESGIF